MEYPKTKIICTIGPSSGDPDTLRKLIQAGMSVARLNFSHGSHEEHRGKIEMVRKISHELNRPVAILQDLCGPKIRVGMTPEDGIRLEPGEELILVSDDREGDDHWISQSYPDLYREVEPGDRILLADGMMELMVKEIRGEEIVCEVVIGGTLTSHKGINLPSSTVKIDALTEKDRDDLRFGLENDVDYVALSFVRSASDITQIKSLISEQGKNVPVIAKIEKHEALRNMEKILEVSDGIMVARGDLGVEIPLEQVPRIQKKLIRLANEMGKPVIIATQMLRSMVNAIRPTRAEATDVSNAVLDGADAVMLSEETASGNYPVEAVKFMARIVEQAENEYPHERYLRSSPVHNIAESVSYATCILADQLKAAAIIATTRSGFTAIQISRHRPKNIIIALSPEQTTVNRLSLYWGCIPRLVEETRDTDERIEKAAKTAAGMGTLEKGDVVVITSGHPVWVEGTTNMIRVKTL